MAAVTSGIIDPAAYIIPPRADYTAGNAAPLVVPPVFGCYLNKDNTLYFTTELSKDSILRIPPSSIEYIGAGVSNTTYKVNIGGAFYLWRTPTYFLTPHPHEMGLYNSIRQTLNADYFRECVLLSKLSPSPYVMKLIACECSPYNTGMLLEWVDGMTLEKWLLKSHTEGEIKKVIEELAAGLAHIHSKGIVHWDIKPENIYVPSDPGRPPFFIDFGISGQLDTPSARKRNINALAKITGKRSGGMRRRRHQPITYKVRTRN